MSHGGGQARTYLHCSLELCLRRGDLRPWALPSCKFSFLLELEGGWLKVWARLRNCGESESSSGKACQAEDRGEAGGVPGGESPGEKSYNTNQEVSAPTRLMTDTQILRAEQWQRNPLPDSWQNCFVFLFTQPWWRLICLFHHNRLLLISRCHRASEKIGRKVKGR